MNKMFIEKCEEVFIKKNSQLITEEKMQEVQAFIGYVVSEEYAYILKNYSGTFLKDDYELYSKYKSPMADENGEEPFMYFLGIEGRDSLFDTYEMYKDQLPDEYYPIALADGGNLICTTNSSPDIYMWIHDDEEDTMHKIFDSIEQMISMIKRNECRKETSRDLQEIGIIEANLDFSEEVLAVLNRIKKQY